ncbi:NADH dehydrogenase [ubiquinone] iron-sulfur protein 4, mitochondrial [Prorops nasuta]|uniref:NADH dehydrogenase [ubiquinone] iron-sulfur protein 4, mitochondrial n=1 Tax=Prorops nasuta TaxID=863751 RepID=UPI0034CF9C23
MFVCVVFYVNVNIRILETKMNIQLSKLLKATSGVAFRQNSVANVYSESKGQYYNMISERLSAVYSPESSGPPMYECASLSDVLEKLYVYKLLLSPEKKEVALPEFVETGLVAGVPTEHIKERVVRIYKPPKNAMQSGTSNTHHWEIDYETRKRWENHLIGWTSSADPLSHVKIQFATKDQAIRFCERIGYKYYIQEPNKVNPKPRSYGQNFSWNKRTRVSTK